MDDKSSQSDKTAAIKEIHNIEKTKVFLLRDLPFITRFSKYYDLTLFNNSLSNKSDSYLLNNKPKPIPNLLGKDNKDEYQNFENQFDDDVSEALELMSGNKLDVNNSKTNYHKNINDSIIEEMRRQSQIDNLL
jgi:hypothetical protein